MSISGIATAPTAVESASDRATDAALAKATAELTADRKAGADTSLLRADQRTVTTATKAAQKADAAATSQAAPAPLTEIHHQQARNQRYRLTSAGDQHP